MRTLILIASRDHKDRLLAQLTPLRQLFVDRPDVSCLIMDDASQDGTFEAVSRFLTQYPWPTCLIVRHRHPLGPGGNQKVGIRHAMERKVDVVLTILGGSPATLSAIPGMLDRFQADDRADYLLATERFGWRSPLAWPRWLRQRGLSLIENRFSGVRIPDWHGPLRIYRLNALREIAFELNTHEAHFHTEILLQLISAGRRRLRTFDVPLHSDRLPSMARAGSLQTIKAALKFRLQRYSLFYDFRYHPELIIPGPKAAAPSRPHYTDKVGFDSPHALVCNSDTLVPPKSRVLDLGCSVGYVARHLTEKKGCSVVGVDRLDPSQVLTGFEYHRLDLEQDLERLCQIIDHGEFDVILILDVLEHLSTPELFLLMLTRRRYQKIPRIIVSTGNVGFLVVRLMLLAGFFNYGNKGILDITHKRLFTVRTFKNLLDQTGFAILRRYGFSLPWKELGLPRTLCRPLEKIHGGFARWRPTLFAYQVLYVTMPITLPARLIAGETAITGDNNPSRLTGSEMRR
ncbi:MAG: methyltransferase domain-containing protein [Elusimicrobiota bacterium]|jgi:2-polyprenyl-3-methyl-5-hydroxy-6-metoxy-1,4-benzoquinol methylase